MARLPDIYLDIETDWSRKITVIGFHSRQTGLVQLVGPGISRRRLLTALPSSGRLFTYNGHSFDLHVIQQRLGIDLRGRFESCDLRWVCQRHGLTGGQKAIEEEIGVRRQQAGLSGRDAIRLWWEHLGGDAEALDTLLDYNREDVEGLRAIRRYVASRGFLRRA